MIIRIFNRLVNKNNWIWEWANKLFNQYQKRNDKEKMKQSFGLKPDCNLNIRNHNNKIIVPKEHKLKNIKKVKVNQSLQNVN